MDFAAIHPALPSWMLTLETRLSSLFTGEFTVLRDAATTVTYAPGKRLRPLLLLLACDACGPVSERAFAYASMVELLHTASLVHDDVVDEAALRRAEPSAPARWGNKFAILLGDYLLARMFEIGMEDGDLPLLRIITEAAAEMSRGVTLELAALDLAASEDIYWQVVAGKTAALYGAAAEIGATIGGATPQVSAAMREFGLAFGHAYQLSDDLIDFAGCASETGKQQGADWRQRRATLPVLHVLRTAPPAIGDRLTALWCGEEHSAAQQAELSDLLAYQGGFDFVQEKVLHYQRCAQRHLTLLPSGEGRTALERLCYDTFPLPVLPGFG